MRERLYYQLATNTAMVIYHIIEVEYQNGERDIDSLMKRLEDLSD